MVRIERTVRPSEIRMAARARALLAAYSARTNHITDEMVRKAAESLELSEVRPPRFGP